MTNYESRHPSDMALHPLSEIREWDEALAVLGIQDSTQTPAEAIRERDEEIEKLRALVVTADKSFELIRCKLIGNLNEPERSAFWEAVDARDTIRRVTSPLSQHERPAENL
jgi:hypothetical protein